MGTGFAAKNATDKDLAFLAKVGSSFVRYRDGKPRYLSAGFAAKNATDKDLAFLAKVGSSFVRYRFAILRTGFAVQRCFRKFDQMAQNQVPCH